MSKIKNDELFLFNFFDLPFVVQEIITKKLINDYEPSTWINFMLSSKNCQELIQISKPKIYYENLSIKILPTKIEFICKNQLSNLTGQEFVENQIFNLENFEKVFNFLEKIQVIKNCKIELLSTNNGFNTKIYDLLESLADCLKFVEGIYFEISFLHDLEAKFMVDLTKNLQKCCRMNCYVRQWNPGLKVPVMELVDSMPKHLEFTFMRSNDADDEFLDLLAKKTNQSNPLKSVCVFSRQPFTMNGVKNFLENATFENQAKISLYPLNSTKSELLEVLNSVGVTETSSYDNFVKVTIKNSVITFCLPLDFEPPPNQGFLFNIRNRIIDFGRRIVAGF